MYMNGCQVYPVPTVLESTPVTHEMLHIRRTPLLAAVTVVSPLKRFALLYDDDKL